MTAFVLDTNVIVSGLLSGDAGSPPAQLLDAMIAGSIRCVISHELFAEYRAVLLRPAIAARHGLTEDEIDIVLEHIALQCPVRQPESEHPEPPDPGDAHLWALMAAEPKAVLVTGDRALIEAAPTGWRVVSPAEAIEEGAL